MAESFVTPEYFKKINKDEARFIFEHAEKQLKETLDTSILIVNRTTTLLTITVGLMAALVGFIVSRLDKMGKFDALLVLSLIALVYLFILAVLLCRNILAKNYLIAGAEPKDFFLDNFFNEGSTNDNRIICFYVNEIESYQERITKNKQANEKRWKLFNNCIKMIVAMPIVFGIIYLIIYLV